MGAWSGTGYSMGSRYLTADATILAEFRLIKASGVNKIRMVADIDSANWMSWVHTAIGLAQQTGLDVLFGVSRLTTLTAANWSTYHDDVMAEVVTAVGLGVTKFVIGNELELRNDGTTLTDPQLITNLKTLATDIKAVYPNLEIHYNVSNGAETQWVTLGSVNKLGGNIYGDNGTTPTFQSRLQNLFNTHGTNAYVSEWNIHYDWSLVTTDEEKQTVEIARRQKIIKDIGYDTAYFFCWRYSNGNDDFSVYKTDLSYRLLFNPLATNNGRRFFVNV